MYHLKYFLIILFTSLLLISCGNQGDETDAPTEMSPESLGYAECIEGVYNGIGDFRRRAFGGHPYTLEVSHNSNEIIFLITDTDREETFASSKVCTTYQNPSFSATEENELLFNLEASSVENNGVIAHTTGMFDIRVSQEEGESVLCNISQLKLYREGDEGSGFLGFGATLPPTYTRSISRVEEVEVRSFAEIKSECDALTTDEGEAATAEQEVADNAEPEETNSQNPTP